MVRAQTRNQEAASEFSKRISGSYPQVQAVILYGSVARGEAHDDSDVDIVILVDAEDRALQDEAITLAMKIGDEFGVFVQEIVETVSSFESRAVEGYPWQRTIARMGRPLFDRGAFARIRDALPPPPRIAEKKSPYRPSRAIIDDHISAADAALVEARTLFQARLWDGVSNRAYYAMFNAASAAVLWCGIEEIRSHRALIDLFGKLVVHDRSVEQSYRHDLESAFKTRLRADYEPRFHIDETTAGALVHAAERFITRIREFVAA